MFGGHVHCWTIRAIWILDEIQKFRGWEASAGRSPSRFDSGRRACAKAPRERFFLTYRHF
jgi:hypothetical protein